MKTEELKSSYTSSPSSPSSDRLGQKGAIPSNKVDSSKEWLEVIPHGLVGGMIPHFCLMIFKQKSGSKKFAIPLSRLQGQIATQQSMHREEPFRFVNDLLSLIKVRIEKCFFLSCDKGHITVQVVLSESEGNPRSMTLNAEDVIPFAIYTGCRFYSTDQFMMDMLEQKMDPPLRKHSIKKPLYLN